MLSSLYSVLSISSLHLKGITVRKFEIFKSLFLILSCVIGIVFLDMLSTLIYLRVKDGTNL